MVKDNDAWFHCGHCGQLFNSGFEFEQDRLCEACGQKPRTDSLPVGEKPVKDIEWKVAPIEKSAEKVEEEGRRSVRKRHRVNVLMRVVVAWTILILGLIALHEYQNKTGRGNGVADAPGILTEETFTDGRTATLNQALPYCHQSLSGFLNAGTPELRNQFVANPIETAGKMANFYRNNPFPKIRTKTLRRTDEEVVQVGDEWMIFTRWKEDAEGGREFDAVFKNELGTWKLDWLHFSRFSEYPWVPFLAGEGPDEAEFRLLARPRLRGDKAERFGARMTFDMVDPASGETDQDRGESPVFQVDRRGDAGLLLEAAFDAKSESNLPFGEGFSSAMEPDDLVRIRVTVKRETSGGSRRFGIEKISACHWIDATHPGFDIESLKDDLFGGS